MPKYRRRLTWFSSPGLIAILLQLGCVLSLAAQPASETSPAREKQGAPDPEYVDVADYGTALTLFWENDVIYGQTDQFYTNGARLEYATLYDWRKYRDPVYDYLPESATREGIFVEDAWVVAQNMYSPTNIAKSDVSYGDRPYAGWTYLGKRYGISRERSYHSFELDLGAVGPASGAKETQTFVHRSITGSPIPHWGNQIPNFFAVRANYYYSRPVTPASWYLMDLAPYVDLSAGNVLTGASLGFTLRLGYLGDGEGHFPLERGVGRVGKDTTEFYLFIRPEASGVAYNGLVQGDIDAQNRYINSNNPAAAAYAYDQLAKRLNGGGEFFTYPGYHALIENEGILEPNTRFLVFDQNLARHIQNPGTKYLLYNTLFQGGETIDETIRLSVLFSALQDPRNMQDPLRLWWLMKTVGRKPGESLDPIAKYLAYRILTEDRPFDPYFDFAMYYMLFQKHDPRKTYTIRHRPFVGGLRGGLVFNYGPVTLLTAVAIRSSEFYQKGYLPTFHKWFTLQATVRF